MSSTINTTVTSMFLSDLTKDRSRIKEITPAVIFKRVLGVTGDGLDRAGVIKALQRQASNGHVLQEYHENLTNPRFVGEVVSFDIGPHPSWMKFAVVKEPLPKPKKGNTLNFIITVTDKPAGKRWTRLIGAIANEANENDEMVPVFRTISDMCEEEDIMKPADESRSHDLIKKEEKPAAQAEAAPSAEEALKEPDKPDDDAILISNGQVVTFVKTDSDHFKITSNGVVIWDSISSIGLEGLEGETGSEFTYIATNDVRRLLLRTCSPSDIVAEFKKHAIPAEAAEVSGGGEKPSDDQEQKGEEVPKENAEETSPEPQKPEGEGETTPPAQIADIDANHQEREKIFTAGEDGIAFNEDAPGCLFKATRDIYKDEWEKMSQEERMALFEKYYEPKKEEPKEEKAVEYWAKKDEIREVDGKKFRAKQDITLDMIKENNGDVTPWVEEVKEETVADIDGTKNQDDVEEADPDEVVIDKGERVNLVHVRDTDGKFAGILIQDKEGNEIVRVEGDEVEQYAEGEYMAAVDITNEMIGEGSDTINIVALMTERLVKVETDIKPIGDIPPKATSIKDDKTRPEDHLMTLFGTTTPNIMHLLNFLKSECTNESYKGEEYLLTGTFPVELLSVWPKYTYSIVRMKNGAYYRIFVCMTDMTRTDSQSWVKTHDEPGRWIRVCDIQDRDVGGLFNRRRV